MNVIQKLIYFPDYRREYLVPVPSVANISAIYNVDDLPIRSQIFVAVYRPTGKRYGSLFDFSHEYEFIGMELR